MTDHKTSTNIEIGAIYWQCLNDAAGYPNGMPYWPEMSANEKYHYTVTALSFLELMAKAGMISITKSCGLEKPSAFGEGDCKTLLDELERRAPAEKAEFDAKIEALRGRTK